MTLYKNRIGSRIGILVVLCSILIFGCNSGRKNGERTTKVFLLDVFVEDTTSFENVSMKIRIKNPSTRDLILNFQRGQGLAQNDIADLKDINSWISLYDSIANRKIDFKLSPLFPSPTFIKSEGQVDLLFFASCANCSFNRKYAANRSVLERIIRNLVRKGIYLVITDSSSPERKSIDTIPVTIDTNFKFVCDKAYVKDFQNAK